MLSPKQKAEELVEKYNDYLQQEMQCIVYVNQAKQCALIAVDEIIYEHNLHLTQFGHDRILFWKEVKQELEKF